MRRNMIPNVPYKRCGIEIQRTLPYRFVSTKHHRYSSELRDRNRRVLFYMTAVAVGTLGITYISVPLYRVFCQATGYGGTTQRVNADKVTPVAVASDGRPIRVLFDSAVSSSMPWKFKPQQAEVMLVPGETALAFYTAKNPTKDSITGVATYNVQPPKAGLYFNKIQCFCFEEQRLQAKEEIDMPILFFIDPEILEDPSMDSVNTITLSYTFFKTDDV